MHIVTEYTACKSRRYVAVFALFDHFRHGSESGGGLSPPAGERYARVGVTGSILPGGRVLQPLGVQLETGPGTFGLAVNRKGVVATADIGYERFRITLIQGIKQVWLERHLWARTPGSKAPEESDPDWKGVFFGIAFGSDRAVWISEGTRDAWAG